MKIKKIIFAIILFTFMLTICSTGVNAINFELRITGDNNVEIGKSITLNAILDVYNDLYVPGEPDGGLGKISSENVTNKAVWTSSDTSIATVNAGKVTGVSSGTVTITAQYDDMETATYTVEVLTTTVVTTPVITPDMTPDIPEKDDDDIIYEEYYIPNENPNSAVFYVETDDNSTIPNEDYDFAENIEDSNEIILSDENVYEIPYDNKIYVENNTFNYIIYLICIIINIMFSIILVVLIIILIFNKKKNI